MPIALTSTPTLLETPDLAALPSPVEADRLDGTCPSEGNLLSEGGFTSDLEGWSSRYGLLRHTVKTYAGEPGAALLVTSDAAPDGGKLAVAGRCLDLEPVVAGQVLIVDAYLLAMPETEGVALGVFFHPEAGCHGEILDIGGPPGVTSETGWTFVTASLPIPQGTTAADFVVRAVSQSASGRALVDRVCASIDVGPSAE